MTDYTGVFVGAVSEVVDSFATNVLSTGILTNSVAGEYYNSELGLEFTGDNVGKESTAPDRTYDGSGVNCELVGSVTGIFYLPLSEAVYTGGSGTGLTTAPLTESVGVYVGKKGALGMPSTHFRDATMPVGKSYEKALKTDIDSHRSANLTIPLVKDISRYWTYMRDSSLTVATPALKSSTVLRKFNAKLRNNEDVHPYRLWDNRDEYYINNFAEGAIWTVTVPYKPGMKADFADLRFSDTVGNKLGYFIESKTDYLTATVKVKLGTSPTVFIWYGNGSAVSESDASKVYYFAETFPGTSIDSSKWTEYNGTETAYTISNNTLTVTGITVGSGLDKWVHDNTRTGVQLLANWTPTDSFVFEATFGGTTYASAIGGVMLGLVGADHLVSAALGCVDTGIGDNYFNFFPSFVEGTTGTYGVMAYLISNVKIRIVKSGTTVKLYKKESTDTDWVLKDTGTTTDVSKLAVIFSGYDTYSFPDRVTVSNVTVSPYSTVDPVGVYVGSWYNLDILRVAGSLKGRQTRTADLTIPLIKEKNNRGQAKKSGLKLYEVKEGAVRDPLELQRTPGHKTLIVKTLGEREGSFNREAGNWLNVLRLGGRLGAPYDAIGMIKVDKVMLGASFTKGYRRSALISTEVREKATRTFDLHLSSGLKVNKVSESANRREYRKSGHKLSTVTETEARLSHRHKESGLKLAGIKELATRLFHVSKNSGIKVDKINSLLKQKSMKVHRTSAMSTRIAENVHRNVHSGRVSSSYIPDRFAEDNQRSFAMWRFYYTGLGSFVAEPACKVTVQKDLKASAEISVGTPALCIERGYYGVRQTRNSGNYLEAQEIITDWEADWKRNAQQEILPVEIQVRPNPNRTVLFSVSPVFMDSQRQPENNAGGFLNIPALGLKVRLGSENFRSSEIQVLPLDIGSSRSGAFQREANATVVNVASELNAEGLLERISAMYLEGSSIGTERILNIVRESALEIPEPCLIAFGATNADRPTAPFEIDFDKPEFIITVDQSEYGVELTKDLYYAVVRDGESLIEITQYDTDTFYAYIYDTDPVTGLSRAMPLDGKTVKAILKGGSPDTTITIDCTIVEAGKVRIDLTSANTGVSGKYFLKFVILAEGYRKEIPEVRDDYLEVQINDASYIEQVE